ncbi:RNA polymerase sigma factor [Echinicola shivajiensis]|uniref:RNA polymerase sigma factor n=1 Tax=Echinicola shivajiensis TaxID=1035916 RepID=UPI001BFC6742|nr:RNA polymerase sigma-70 factor [Echinicola shivajiensis]
MPLAQNNTENKWILGLISGDEHAFRLFFDKYSKRIYGFAFKFLKLEDLAQDVTQEVFIKIWQERKKMAVIDDFEAYLFQIVRRKCIDNIRKISRNQKLLDQVKSKMEPSVNPFLEYDNMGFLEKIKENLSPQQKVVFELSRTKGLSYEDIAHELKISKNTVRNHMVEAIKVLRKLTEHSIYLILIDCFMM